MSDYNALDTTRRLEGRGFTRDQAETLAQLLADLWGAIVTRQVLREELATTQHETAREFGELRQDMAREFGELRQDMAREFGAVRQEAATFRQDMGREFGTVRQEISTGLRDLEQRMTIKLGGMLVVLVGILAALQHFWR